MDAEHVAFSVRVPAPLADALRRRAVDAERSLAAEVRLALRRHVEGGGHPPIPTAAGAAPIAHKIDPLEASWTHATA